MAKTADPVTIAVPGIAGFPRGQNVTVYDKGVEIYAKARVNGKANLQLDDGSTIEVTISNIQVGPLIDHICATGAQAPQTVGRIYSPLALVQALTDAQSGSGPLDVTELYAAITVMAPIPAPNPNGGP